MKTALITLSFCLFFYTSATAINEYQYPQKNLSDKLCSTLINNLDDSSFPYSKKKPFRVKIDLQIMPKDLAVSELNIAKLVEKI